MTTIFQMMVIVSTIGVLLTCIIATVIVVQFVDGQSYYTPIKSNISTVYVPDLPNTTLFDNRDKVVTIQDIYSADVCKVTYNPDTKTMYNDDDWMEQIDRLVLTSSAGNTPSLIAAANIENIYDELSCNNTLRTYLLKGWEIIQTYESFETGIGSRYSNIILERPINN